MAAFIGKYEAKADMKGRIFIPSVYRKLLPEGEKEHVVLLKDPDKECLIVYPENVWNKILLEVQEKLNPWDANDKILLMHFASEAELLDIDSQGRVLITRKNMHQIGAENNEIMFVGMVDRFAIWSKNKFEQTRLTPTDFALRLRERMNGNP